MYIKQAMGEKDEINTKFSPRLPLMNRQAFPVL